VLGVAGTGATTPGFAGVVAEGAATMGAAGVGAAWAMLPPSTIAKAATVLSSKPLASRITISIGSRH
jgi:hypothetical protein